MTAELAPNLLTEPEATPGPGVYVLVDSARSAIYIGATKNLTRRLREHASKGWWPLVSAVEWYPQPDWELALHVERGLIRALSPELNRQSTVEADRAANQFLGPLRRAISDLITHPERLV